MDVKSQDGEQVSQEWKNILPACVTSSQQGENRQCQCKAWIVSCHGPTYGTSYSATIKQYIDIIAV